jgi:glycosyltransferase involved in cell wall biosynthesis
MSTARLDRVPLPVRSESTVLQRDLRVALVADTASAKFGGESIHPIHYFRIMRSRGIEAWLVCNGRTKEELEELFPEDAHRIFYVRNTAIHRLLSRLENMRPRRLGVFTFGLLSRCVTQRRARTIVKELVKREGVNVVHQPIPLAAKECSFLYDLGAPLVVGPLNGAMEFPPGFRRLQSTFEVLCMRVGRWASQFMNRLAPGKLRASTVLVANERTRLALPAGLQGQVKTLIDNCVDLATWKPADRTILDTQAPARFVYLGRLVDWKAVDLLLEAFKTVAQNTNATLDLIGDGDDRQQLEAQAKSLGLGDRARFLGWKKQAECAEHLRTATALVLPSLYECGGAVVLEAMASSLAVIATDWGGPADYLDATCGFLIAPTSRAAFISGLANAMVTLAKDTALAMTMGAAGRKRVESSFDWQWKVDRTLEIYADAIQRSKSGASVAA